MRHLLTTGGAILVLAWSMGCGDVDIHGPDWPDWQPPIDPAGSIRDTSEWRGPIAAGKHIEVKGVFGDIRAVRASGNDVVVTAIKIGRPNDVAAVDIEAVPHALGVTICAVYPDVPGRVPNACEPGAGGNMTVVDGGRGVARVVFTVQVPDGVTLVARSLTGNLEATSLRSDAFLYTQYGDVRVSTTRLATGRTLSGSITASIGLPDWGRDLEFTTMAGDVQVTIPAATNAEVRAAATSGRVRSDFPLSEMGPGDMRGTIGRGGPTLRLSTLAGDISLQRGT
ncbi:MAG: DUF4097 family beta strand repeat protein [Gemmatimonadales bacterium]|nr:DUF4097 family beta strand repeat protein [Gemmatimonadales bacterium]